MLKSLPPVGNPISLKAHSEPQEVFSDVFGANPVFLYGSGTMALASALMAIRDYRAVSAPEVLLPAYACPDLISAAIHAGLRPVLVDLTPDRPWMDLDVLKGLIGLNTVAVIAVHFLGVPERLQDIRSVLEGTDVLLVEDSAQLFPSSKTDAIWQGDMVILSFGRGKPVSLLGGGAVISRHPSLETLLPEAETARLKPAITGKLSDWRFNFKVRAYNALLSPLGYSILKHAPFLNLGATVYKPLLAMDSFDQERVSLLAANIIDYQKRSRQVQVWISDMLSTLGNEVLDLPDVCSVTPNLPLLRYPVLFKNLRQRDCVYDVLFRVGLGVSKMYQQPLPQVQGLEDILPKEERYPNALDFSRRLLTLPCHFGVRHNYIDMMKKNVSELLINYLR